MAALEAGTLLVLCQRAEAAGGAATSYSALVSRELGPGAGTALALLLYTYLLLVGLLDDGEPLLLLASNCSWCSSPVCLVRLSAVGGEARALGRRSLSSAARPRSMEPVLELPLRPRPLAAPSHTLPPTLPPTQSCTAYIMIAADCLGPLLGGLAGAPDAWWAGRQAVVAAVGLGACLPLSMPRTLGAVAGAPRLGGRSRGDGLPLWQTRPSGREAVRMLSQPSRRRPALPATRHPAWMPPPAGVPACTLHAAPAQLPSDRQHREPRTEGEPHLHPTHR